MDTMVSVVFVFFLSGGNSSGKENSHKTEKKSPQKEISIKKTLTFCATRFPCPVHLVSNERGIKPHSRSDVPLSPIEHVLRESRYITSNVYEQSEQLWADAQMHGGDGGGGGLDSEALGWRGLLPRQRDDRQFNFVDSLFRQCC